jgi:DNA-binding response OmpR family regulator
MTLLSFYARTGWKLHDSIVISGSGWLHPGVVNWVGDDLTMTARIDNSIAQTEHSVCGPMRVLVVEDEKKTSSFIRKALQAEGFAVDVLEHGDEVLPAVEGTAFDAVVLDIMLPGRDGLSVLHQMRERGLRLPVLLLSARGAVSERVEGLNAGADDYLSKPFALAELVARIRALVRRGGEAKLLLLRVADLTLDTVTREVKRGDRVIDLAPREYRLLEFLMRSPGRPRSRMAIVESVWDYDFDPGTNLVDVYVMRLREKIDGEFEPKLLQTVRGVGYVLKGAP